MVAAGFHSLILLNVVLLALPPGWCCRTLVPDHVPVKAAKCCQHSRDPQTPSDHHPGQRDTDDRCCCVRVATVDQRPASIEQPVAVAPVAMIVDSPLVATTVNFLAPVEQRAGPLRLHVLQCVWRC